MQQSAIHRQAREAAQRTKALRDAALQGSSGPLSTYMAANRRYAADLAGVRRAWWPTDGLRGVHWPRALQSPTLRERPLLRGIAIASGVVMVAAATHALTPAVTETAAGALVRAAPGSKTLMEGIGHREACFSRVPVEGSDGQLVGVLRTGGCDGLPDQLRQSPPYLTAEVSEAEARRFADFVRIVEGQHRRGRGTFLGHDLSGFARVVWYGVRGQRIGGSSALQTAVKNLTDSPGSLGFSEKLAALWQTAAVAAHLADDERDRLVALHTPVIFTTENSRFGPSLAGGLIPYAFGKTTISEMSDGEMCVAAAALRAQVILSGAGETGERRARSVARNEQVKARAITACVDRLESRGDFSEVEAEAAREEILAMRFDHLGEAPKLDNRLAQILPGARMVLQDALDRTEHRPGGPLVTPLDPDSHARFHDNVQGLLSEINWDSSELCPPWGGGCSGERLDILGVVLEDVGTHEEMRLGYATRPGLWEGPPTVTRSLGSIPKVLLAPHFVSSGLGAGGLCRRAWAGLHDGDFPGVSDCNLPQAKLTLRQMIGQSSNLGYADALNAAGWENSLAHLRALGFSVPESVGNLDQQRAVATGTAILAPPAIAARAMTAMARGSEGKPPVARIATPFGPSGADINLRKLGIQEDAWDQIRPALGGALDPGGTLQALAPELSRRSCDLSRTTAKTGTSEATRESGGRRVRDRLVFLRTACGGRTLTVVTMVGSPRIELPLTQVGTADIRRLTLAALDAVLGQ